MRFLADESCDFAVVRSLRAASHDVTTIAESSAGIEDQAVIDQSIREARILLTEDKDFGDLAFRQAMSVPGIVLLRIESSRRLRKGPRLMAAIERFGDTLFGRYTVIEDIRFRSRPLRST